MSISRLYERRARIRSFRRPKWKPELMELELRRLLSAYIVNDPGDAPLDSAVGAGETATGTITLRSAIEQVNIDDSGSITFGSAMTISVESQLDPITAAGVTIDGGSQGSVVISGASGYDGLVIKGGGATIENLVFESFLVGVVLQSSQNTIEDDDIGPDVANSNAGGNVMAGLEDTSSDNTIQDNLVDDNLGVGILLDGASDDQLTGNYFGTDPTYYPGYDDDANGSYGLELANGASGNKIGGLQSSIYDSPGPDSNIFVYNDGNGEVAVEIAGNGTSGNQVAGNEIGQSSTQSVNIIQDASDNTIGGKVSLAGNFISGSVVVGSSVTDECAGDAIFENTIEGSIDLGDDGPTANNSSGHTGPNLFQNYPVLSTSVTSSEVIQVTGFSRRRLTQRTGSSSSSLLRLVLEVPFLRSLT